MDLSLLPRALEAEIPESYRDEMGHMNVMWYTHLFDRAVITFFAQWGCDEAYMLAEHAGTFALTQHFRYLAEVRVGQRVAIHCRLVGRSERRVHFIQYMLHADGRVAATVEALAAHVEMRVRRSSPWPPQIAAALDRLAEEHERLVGPPRLCGALRA
ncbi:MAG TPA: thioesterase family protein [Gemmatales bacterium]|nr:thioesterase family protein [Gemmatales bacterium]